MRRDVQVQSVKDRRCNQFANRDDRRGIASIAEVLLLGVVAWVVWLGLRIILAPIHETETNLNESACGPIVSLSVISEGRKILARRGVSDIIALDLEQVRIQKIFEWNDRPLQAVCVSQDGATCLLSIEDREVLLFRGSGLLMSESLNAKSSVQLAMSLNGQTAVRLVDGALVRRWDLSGDEIEETNYSFLESVDRIALDFEGNRMLASTSRGALHLCNAKTGVVFRELEGGDHLRADPVFSEDGSCVAVARNRSVTLYELPSGRAAWTAQFDSLEDRDWLTSVAISPNGQFVAASGIAVPIRVLSRTGGRVLHQFSRNSTGGVVFSPSSDVVYSGTRDGTICQWSLADGCLVEYGKAD